MDPGLAWYNSESDWDSVSYGPSPSGSGSPRWLLCVAHTLLLSLYPFRPVALTCFLFPAHGLRGPLLCELAICPGSPHSKHSLSRRRLSMTSLDGGFRWWAVASNSIGEWLEKFLPLFLFILCEVG